MNINNNFIQLYNILMENVNQISDDINILKEEIEQKIGEAIYASQHAQSTQSTTNNATNNDGPIDAEVVE